MRGHRGSVVLLGIVVAVGHALGAGGPTAEERLRLLEEQLRQAQEEIRQLRHEVEAAKKRPEQPPAAPATAPEVVTGTKAAEPWRPPAWLERITLFGDVRFRVEGFYNRPDEQGEAVPSRTRERIRARLGLLYTHSDELSGTVRLATGNPEDPISHNVSLGSLFESKSISLNFAYLQFTPGATFGWRPGLLTLQAGKFPLPHFRIGELVFDDDLAPEGLGQRLALLGKPAGVLQSVDVHVLEWVFREVADDLDGWMIGGQIVPKAKVGSVSVELGLGQFWWYQADLIAEELERNDALQNTNLLETALVNGERRILGYRSDFNLTTLTLAMTVPAVHAKPLRVGLDWVYNWGAASDDDFGVQGMVKLGVPKQRGDWAITLLYQYLQREAALSAFTNSNFGDGGTNVMGPMVALEYQLLDPLTLRGRTFFVNRIVKPAGKSNATLVRMQLDAMLRW